MAICFGSHDGPDCREVDRLTCLTVLGSQVVSIYYNNDGILRLSLKWEVLPLSSIVARELVIGILGSSSPKSEGRDGIID